jgi:hypothetical protein
MDNFINFEPNSEDERFFFETHRNLSIATSKLIRSLPQEHRLFALKEGNPSDFFMPQSESRHSSV